MGPVDKPWKLGSFAKGLPQPEELFFTVPLYRPMDLEDDHGVYISGLKMFLESCDGYCIECERVSVFTAVKPEALGRDASIAVNQLPMPGLGTPHRQGGEERKPDPLRDHSFPVVLSCRRERSHLVEIHFTVIGRKLLKVGQYPSVADHQEPSLRKYRSMLGTDDYRELTKGVRLAASGVGIGSYVYLRRIFERLIDEAHEEARKTAGWDEYAYQGKRVDEKIQVLASMLPPILVENRAMYGILSKGIHELSEEECLEYFPVVRGGIELILNARIEQLERRRKEDELRNSIAAVARKLKGDKGS